MSTLSTLLRKGWISVAFAAALATHVAAAPPTTAHIAGTAAASSATTTVTKHARARLGSTGASHRSISARLKLRRHIYNSGAIFAYGDAVIYGSPAALTLNSPVVAMAVTPAGAGYWLAAADGGVFSFGDAKFYGSMGGKPLNQPVVGIAATPDGGGYWLVAADGGVFSFGDAKFYGSAVNETLGALVAGITATATGQGYWIVAADGGVFSFGDAKFYGSAGNEQLSTPVVGMAAVSGDHGYWLATANGSVLAYGDAKLFGSNGSAVPAPPVASITATSTGGGYYLLEPDGINYSFADPSTTGFPGYQRIVEAAASQVTADPDTSQGPFCNPYGPCEEWCALFATWVWRDAEIQIPSYAFTGDVYYWAAANGAVLSPSSHPSPGDAVLYGTGPATVSTSVHMGIVAQVWPDGAIIAIEGDAGPSPTGYLSVIINGPYLPSDSQLYNGFPVYAFAQPVQ